MDNVKVSYLEHEQPGKANHCVYNIFMVFPPFPKTVLPWLYWNLLVDKAGFKLKQHTCFCFHSAVNCWH